MEDGIYDLMGLNRMGELPAKSASPTARDEMDLQDEEGGDASSYSLPKFPRNSSNNRNNNAFGDESFGKYTTGTTTSESGTSEASSAKNPIRDD